MPAPTAPLHDAAGQAEPPPKPARSSLQGRPVLTSSAPVAGHIPSSYGNMPALHSMVAPNPPTLLSILLACQMDATGKLEPESSAELLALLFPEWFSRNHSPAMLWKDAWRRVAFTAGMGAVKFLHLHNSGSGSAGIIDDCWQEMRDDLNVLSFCGTRFLCLLLTK